MEYKNDTLIIRLFKNFVLPLYHKLKTKIMMFINNVSDITTRLNVIISNLEKTNISCTNKIEKDFNHALDWNYIEIKAINLRLIEFYKEVIEGIADMTYEQCKECFVRIKENNTASLVSIDFYQNTTLKIREAKYYQIVILKVSEILKSM